MSWSRSKSPKLEGDRLTFDVDVLEGDLAGGDGGASVFMDLVNLPARAPQPASRAPGTPVPTASR